MAHSLRKLTTPYARDDAGEFVATPYCGTKINLTGITQQIESKHTESLILDDSRVPMTTVVAPKTPLPDLNLTYEPVHSTLINEAIPSMAKHLKLQESEAAVLNAAAQIYSACLVAGKVGDGEESKWMARAVKDAIRLALATDDAIVADGETSGGGFFGGEVS